MSKQRAWVFTVNNYGEDDVKQLQDLGYKYLIIAKEHECKECATDADTPHLQGYLEMRNQVRFNTLHTAVPRAHFEPRRATADSAIAYCKKGCQSHAEWEADGVDGPNYGKHADFVEYGTPPAQGKRNDLHALRDAIKANPNIHTRVLLDDHAHAFARFPRFIEACRKAYGQPVTLDWTDSPNVWLSGPPGSGKSHTARVLSGGEENLYVKDLSKWWDGYEGQDFVVIEDLHPDHAKEMTTFLKIWGDRYPFPAQVKGGQLYIRPKVIIVTTNYTMAQIFPNGEDRAAIGRRFKNHDVIKFGDDVKSD